MKQIPPKTSKQNRGSISTSLEPSFYQKEKKTPAPAKNIFPLIIYREQHNPNSFPTNHLVIHTTFKV